MGLFDAKYCSICGDKIKLFGNNKLADGNMCNTCAGKLSYWFHSSTSSTVENIKSQLEYREANKEKVAAFQATRTYGDYMKVMIDDHAGTFLIARTGSILSENPDVLKLTDITGVEPDIKETKNEMKHSVDGKQVPYDPARYVYSYEFYLSIRVNNPYFNEMRIRLNPSTVKIEEPEKMKPVAGPKGKVIQKPVPTLDELQAESKDYNIYLSMAKEIYYVLLGLDPAVEEAKLVQEEQPVQRAKLICPSCGAVTYLSEQGTCEVCGAPIKL